jgi:hypothetical protein
VGAVLAAGDGFTSFCHAARSPGGHSVSTVAPGVFHALSGSAACVVDSIWKGQAWSITAKFVFEGVVYSVVTAGTFGWLWPEAAASV